MFEFFVVVGVFWIFFVFCFVFKRLAVRPGSITPIVLSSKALPLREVVEWCLVVAPLCWEERGARKGKAFKRDCFFHRQKCFAV